jgi:putative selenate reductase
LGAELKLNHRVTVPPQALLREGFDAVYVATGFQRDAVLKVEGIEGTGVLTALRFLESVARDEEPELGSRVLVIGGGNTAMDAARTAQRLTGHPSTVVYRRTQAEMPAEAEELRDLFDEGNDLIELASPSRVILKEGCVTALECVRNELGEPGPDGRRKPVPVQGSEFEIDADAIILAIGQQPDIAFLDDGGIRFRKNGAVITDPGTRQTGMRNVFAGGDVTRGPAIIIEACTDGRRAAEAICQQLGIVFESLPARPAELSDAQINQVKRVRASKVAAHEPDLLPVEKRAGFDLVELTLTEEAARSEAARCLQCSTFCDKCVEVCPNRANYTYLISPLSLTLPVLACQNGDLAVTGEELFQASQSRQIIHVDDLCNECGNCATFCVHQGKPYTDKPRLFMQETDFALEENNAFCIQANTIRRREKGREAQLTKGDGGLTFENRNVRLSLSPEFEIQEMALKESFEGSLSLREAVEMNLILGGISTSAPFLLE